MLHLIRDRSITSFINAVRSTEQTIYTQLGIKNMCNTLKHTVNEFEAIQLIGNGSSAEQEFLSGLNVERDYIHSIDRNTYLYGGGLSISSNDLLIINIDAYGQTETGYLLFLSKSFRPDIPVVLITGDCLTQKTHDGFLLNGVLEIVQLTDASRSYAYSQI